MPAPLNVNREAVRTLAVAIGVRAAAREMGLKEPTVQAWSDRGNWFEKVVQPVLPPTIRPRATNATKGPARAMSDALARLGEDSKLLLAKAGAKAAKHFAKLPGAKIAKQSGDYKNIVSAKAQLHGWDTRFQGTQFSLNVLNVGSFGLDIDAS